MFGTMLKNLWMFASLCGQDVEPMENYEKQEVEEIFFGEVWWSMGARSSDLKTHTTPLGASWGAGGGIPGRSHSGTTVSIVSSLEESDRPLVLSLEAAAPTLAKPNKLSARTEKMRPTG